MHRVCVQAHRPSSHSLTLSLYSANLLIWVHTQMKIWEGAKKGGQGGNPATVSNSLSNSHPFEQSVMQLICDLINSGLARLVRFSIIYIDHTLYGFICFTRGKVSPESSTTLIESLEYSTTKAKVRGSLFFARPTLNGICVCEAIESTVETSLRYRH